MILGRHGVKVKAPGSKVHVLSTHDRACEHAHVHHWPWELGTLLHWAPNCILNHTYHLDSWRMLCLRAWRGEQEEDQAKQGVQDSALKQLYVGGSWGLRLRPKHGKLMANQLWHSCRS